MSTSMWIRKERLEALTDGVYAVALTLLVLDLRLPAVPDVSGALLPAALLGLTAKAGVWLLSFWVGVLFWLAQDRMLRHYHQFDRPAILIEFAQLALVSLLPFSTALMGEHGAQVAAALIYALHITLLAALAVLRSARIQRCPWLRSSAFDPVLARALARRAGALLACALVASLLAPIVPGWNMLAMLGIAVQRPRIGRAGPREPKS